MLKFETTIDDVLSVFDAVTDPDTAKKTFRIESCQKIDSLRAFVEIWRDRRQAYGAEDAVAHAEKFHVHPHSLVKLTQDFYKYASEGRTNAILSQGKGEDSLYVDLTPYVKEARPPQCSSQTIYANERFYVFIPVNGTFHSNHVLCVSRTSLYQDLPLWRQ